MTSASGTRPTSPSQSSPARMLSIVAATDFSEPSSIALKWAAALANAHQCPLTIVHAVDASTHGMDNGANAPNKVVNDLDALASRLKGEGISVKTEYHFGKPWRIINDAARAAGADLIVMGKHGKGGLTRLLGGTADRVIRTANASVLVVPPNAQRIPGVLNTILVATDFSEESALATSMAVRLLHATPAGGRMILLHTVALIIEHPMPSIPVVVPEYWDDAERKARTRLESLAAQLRSDRVRVEAIVVRGFPSIMIENESKRSNVDLIAMGTVGHGAVNRFLLGSVAERVLHHAPCPVLTVRRPDADEPVRISAT